MKRLINEELTKTERLISKELILIGDNISGMGIEDLAEAASVSTSLVVKYAKKLGFSGFKELKYYVLEECKSSNISDGNYLISQQQKINGFYEYVQKNYEMVEDVAISIMNADHVCFYGGGNCVGVAKYVASQISSKLKKTTMVISDYHILESEIKKPKPKRLLILLVGSLTYGKIPYFIKYMEISGDNYIVIYEEENYLITNLKGYCLRNKNLLSVPNIDRDRLLCFIYFELVINEIGALNDAKTALDANQN